MVELTGVAISPFDLQNIIIESEANYLGPWRRNFAARQFFSSMLRRNTAARPVRLVFSGLGCCRCKFAWKKVLALGNHSLRKHHRQKVLTCNAT
jgi:hypothetical protein